MIEGVEVEVRRDAVWIRSATPLSVLTSAVEGGDLEAARHVVNMHVPRGYDDPAGDLRVFGRRLGITEPFVGLMTAAWTHEARTVCDEVDEVRVVTVATVGLGAPSAAGVTAPVAWQPGTINLVVLLDARLERTAAVNAVVTVTEAKVGALAEAGIVTADGLPATGTVTDAVVVGWTGRGPRVPYLGPGTRPGWCLARAVRRAVGQGIPAR
jgi:iron complex transport system ATP-binding protein